MSTRYITEHFSWNEMECHDGTEIPDEVRPNLRMLCHLLEEIRARWQGPLVVVSGYRTPSYNAKVGGAKNSQHVKGLAADIRPVALAEVGRLATSVQGMIMEGKVQTLGGLGIYKNWIHVDCRPKSRDGHIARWVGRGIGSEPA